MSGAASAVRTPDAITRDRVVIAVALAAITLVAWLYLFREAASMQSMAMEGRMHEAMGMSDMRAWGAGDWLALFVMWAAMMIGMMLPSASPVIMLVLGVYRRRGDRRARLSSLAFVTGYLAVWTMFSWVSFVRAGAPSRGAGAPNGALTAASHARGADEGAELHDGLIEGPGGGTAPARSDRGTGGPERPVGPAAGQRGMERAPEHAGDVGVDGGRRSLEREARDRARRIPSDAGQAHQDGRIRRDQALVLGQHRARQPMEVGRAAIVAQALPAFAHHGGLRPGQRLDRRVAREEAVVVGLHPRDLRLLQHELRDEHVVRIAGAAPRKVAAVAAEPAEQPPAELDDVTQVTPAARHATTRDGVGRTRGRLTRHGGSR